MTNQEQTKAFHVIASFEHDRGVSSYSGRLDLPANVPSDQLSERLAGKLRRLVQGKVLRLSFAEIKISTIKELLKI